MAAPAGRPPPRALLLPMGNVREVGLEEILLDVAGLRLAPPQPAGWSQPSSGRPWSSRRRLNLSSPARTSSGWPSASLLGRDILQLALVLCTPADLVLTDKNLGRPSLRLLAGNDSVFTDEDLQRLTLRLLAGKDIPRPALVLRVPTDLVLAGKDLR